MAERPILFSDAMVRAILSGTKTQTRRVMTPQPIEGCGAPVVGAYHPIVVRRGIEEPSPERWGASTEEQSWPCPYGQPGDRLWVRETLRNTPGGWTYGADGASVLVERDSQSYLAMASWAHHKESDVCVSIHMPRWASRLTLEITFVRVERVQSISEDDARAEGCSGRDPEPAAEGGTIYAMKGRSSEPSPRAHFMHLWDSINGKRDGCSWAANPWVWAIAFRRVSP